MTIQDERNCPTCGALLPRGEERCPNGHVSKCPGEETAEFASSELEERPASARAKLSNTIFECYRCNRLVETQQFSGRVITPKFCPWCGKPASTILGRELDGYRIDEVLARGGFGIVYVASNIAQPAMKAVVKILRPTIAYSSGDFIKIFVEEARLTEAIGQTCWNIVRVSNVREKPWPYFFMEYIRGTSLDNYTAKTGNEVPLRDCVGYLRGIAKALAATHAKGRVHRDLKPLNIMVIRGGDISQPEDRVKLLDFGLAMKIASRGERAAVSASTRTGSIATGVPDSSPVQSAGTPEYMAPESFEGINDFQADVYAFGVTAFEVLTGHRPWRDPPAGTDRLQYWRTCHQVRRPPSVRESRHDAPKWLTRVIADCLHKDPGRRVPADQLLRKLRAPLPRWIWASVAAAMLLVLALAWYAVRPREPRAVAGWELDERAVTGQSTVVYVASAEQLARARIVATIDRDATEYSWSATGDGAVEVAADPSRPHGIRLSFPDAAAAAAAMAAGTITVEGTRASVLKSSTISGELRVVLDPTPPAIAAELHSIEPSHAPEPRVVVPGSRFHPRKVQLAIHVDEAHPSTVSLVADGVDTPIAGRQLAGKPGWWSFPLSTLAAGECVARVQARDRAANRSATPPFRFTVDPQVDFDLIGKDVLLARRRAFIEFRFDDVLREITLHDAEGTRAFPLEFYRAGGITSELDLVALLESAEPLSLADLAPGESYYLATPVATGETALSFRVRVKDGAVPPNEKELVPAPLPLPAAPGDDDFREVSIRFEGEENPHPIETSRLVPPEGNVTGPKRFRCEPGAESVEASELVLRLRPGRFQRAHSAGARSVAVTADTVTFRGIALRANVENRLVLVLEDPLDRELRRSLSLLPDTEEPTLSVAVRPSNRAAAPAGAGDVHEVASGDELSLEVLSDEELSFLSASVGATLAALEAIPTNDPARHAYRLATLRVFGLGEGEHVLRVSARDLVGHPAAAEKRIILNPSGPRWKTYPELEEGILHLSEGNPVFELTDGNGVVSDTVRITLRRSSDAAEIPLPLVRIDPPPPGRNDEPPARVDVTASLESLLDPCEGTLSARGRDALGKETLQSWPFVYRPPEDWKPFLEWKGILWIRIEGASLYISRTEISNRLFRHEGFLDGSYRDAALAETYVRPKYWTEAGDFPEIRRDGKPLPADAFPVVGISPVEAEAFAREVFGARLPAVEEWLAAARMTHRPVEGGVGSGVDNASRRGLNYRLSWNDTTSLLHGRHADDMAYRGQWVPWRAVEVGAGARSPQEDAEPARPAVLHQLGNVAEWVRLGEDDYGAVGWSFDVDFTLFDLNDVANLQPVRSSDGTYRKSRDFRKGFRMVMDLSSAPGEFKRSARRER